MKTRALVIGTTVGFTKYIEREREKRGCLEARNELKKKEKGKNRKKIEKAGVSIYIYIWLFKVGEK